MSPQDKIEMMRVAVDAGRFSWNDSPVGLDFFLANTNEYREGVAVVYEGDVDVDQGVEMYRTIRMSFRLVAVLQVQGAKLRKGGLGDMPKTIKRFMDFADGIMKHMREWRDPETGQGIGIVEESIQSLGTTMDDGENHFAYGQRFFVVN